MEPLASRLGAQLKVEIFEHQHFPNTSKYIKIQNTYKYTYIICIYIYIYMCVCVSVCICKYVCMRAKTLESRSWTDAFTA